MEETNSNNERREFSRIDYAAPLACKICKEETISKLFQGYTSNISQAGLLCNLRETVSPDDIIWLAFDRGTLIICTELEKHALIYQNGIIGKVVRVESKGRDNFDVGIKFITRQEKVPESILSENRIFGNE